jgi:hypothetical protein
MEENKMLFANVPLSSQTIDLRSGRQILGTVPRHNLMKMRPGTRVRFAGRVWAVKFMDPAYIEVEAASSKGAVIELSYGGSGTGGLDSFHAQALLDSIFDLDESSSCMSAPLWALMEPLLAKIRNQVGPDSLPFEKTEDGIRYFTFAGSLANKVIARWFGGNTKAESDLTITSPKPLDWSRLPTDPVALLPQAEEVFSPSTHQTVFQQRLPVDMQRDEWLQEWIQDQSVADALKRLQSAPTREVTAGSFTWLLQ